MATSQAVRSDLAVPPGEYLAEVVESLGMSQADLARRMGRPSQAINEIVLGKKAITPETALQLEKVTGVPAHIWTGLEDEYRLVLAGRHEEELLAREASSVDTELYRVMAKLGWVPNTRDATSKARELCKFFGVASLEYVKDARLSGHAFRVANRDTASGFALAAWMRGAEIAARDMECEPFNAARLREVLIELRSHTLRPPSHWLSVTQELLAAAGVSLVLQPHLPKTYANGATFWTSREKAVVVVSLRGVWADIFWFTLFHELGHVLLHGTREPHVSIDKADDLVEVEANAFAADHLIPRRAYEDFVSNGNFTLAAVEAFSDTVGIAVGVVVGRLQHDGLVPYSRLNSLRERYKFVSR